MVQIPRYFFLASLFFLLLLSVTIHPVSGIGPVADFTGTPTTGILPLTVTFTDSSTNIPTGWAWFFGDEKYREPWIKVNGSSGWMKREGHSTVVMPDGSIVLMGGKDDITYYNDTWRSTDNGATWTKVNGSSGWAARSAHSSVTMADGSIVLMGGYDGTSDLNDVWRSTDNGAMWTQQTAGAGWTPRESHRSVVMPDGSIVLMGGYDGGLTNDVWRSTDNGATWTLVNAGAGWSQRYGHYSVTEPDGSIVLMGGDDGISFTNDVWWSPDNGATWTRQTAGAGWSARNYHRSVAMPDGSIVLMGGVDTGGDKNDVWRSTDSGVSWTRINASAGWSARECHSSVVMPDGSIVLTGGYDGVNKLNDTWRFNPVGSSVQHPLHTFNTAGTYTVYLTASNADGSNTKTRANYITVTAHAPPPPPPDPGGSSDYGGQAPAPAPAPPPAKPEPPKPEPVKEPEKEQQEQQQEQQEQAQAPEAQPVEGLAGVTVTESAPVGFAGMSFNADGQNSVSIDLTAASQAHATVTTFFDHVEVYTHSSPGVRIFFYFDSYETKDHFITGTAKRVEFTTDPLVVNVSTGNISGSVRAVLTSFDKPVTVKNTITGDITPATVNKYNTLLAQDNQTLAGIAYLMDFRRGNLTSTGAANVTMTVPPSWVAMHGGKDAVRITRISDETGMTELLGTTYLGTNPAGNMIFRGDSPHGTSLFGLVTAKATAVEKAAHPNETFVPSSKPAMITNVGMFGWLIGIVVDNPVVIVVLIAILATVAYFGWWKRRL